MHIPLYIILPPSTILSFAYINRLSNLIYFNMATYSGYGDIVTQTDFGGTGLNNTVCRNCLFSKLHLLVVIFLWQVFHRIVKDCDKRKKCMQICLQTFRWIYLFIFIELRHIVQCFGRTHKKHKWARSNDCLSLKRFRYVINSRSLVSTQLYQARDSNDVNLLSHRM